MNFWQATTSDGLTGWAMNAGIVVHESPLRRHRQQLVADKTTSSKASTIFEKCEYVVRAEREMTDSRVVKTFFLDCRDGLHCGSSHILLDLSQVEQADTKLLATVLALYQLAHTSSVTMEIILSSSLKNLVEVCRLDSVFARLPHRINVRANH